MEALGFEKIVHFEIDAKQVLSEDALDLGEDAELLATDTSIVAGRFDAASRARVGDQIEVAVRSEAAHFFDPDSGLAIRS